MSSNATRLGTFMMAALLFGAAPAQAAMPPLKVAQARQASVRGAMQSGPAVDISVTVLGNILQSFRASNLRLGASQKLELDAAYSGANQGTPDPQKKPPTLVIDAQAPMPWSVVFALLASPDPLASLQATLGVIDPRQNNIETLGEDFVYRYGVSPRVVLSRDFSQMRRVFARVGGVDWEFRLSGDLGAGGLPERVDILRAGAPYVNIQLSLYETSKSSKNKR